MKNVILAALKNEGLVIDSSAILEVKFMRKTCSDHTLGAVYLVLVHDEDEEIYQVCEVFMNCEDLTADFGGCPLFESEDYTEAGSAFNEA